MSKENGGPAIPDHAMTYDHGLTKRDWFAGLAMQAFLSHHEWLPHEFPHSHDARNNGHRLAALFSYEMADAMLKERDR